jgi:hypothetical protein
MINFFNEDIDFKFKGKLALKKWLKSVAESEGYKLIQTSSLSIILKRKATLKAIFLLALKESVKMR